MRSSGTKDEGPNFEIMEDTEVERALGALAEDSFDICSNFDTRIETGLLDRDPDGLDGLLLLPLGFCKGLSDLDLDGDELDLRRASGELEGLEGRQLGKEPVDTLFCNSFAGMSTPSLFQYTGGVCDLGGVVTLGDDRLPKEGEGVLARTGLTSLVRSLNSSAIGVLRRTTLEFVSDSTGFALLLVTGICQMGRGSLDALLFCRAVVHLDLRSISFSKVGPRRSVFLSNRGIALVVFLDRGSTSDNLLTSLLSVDATDRLEAIEGSAGTYCTGDIAG